VTWRLPDDNRRILMHVEHFLQRMITPDTPLLPSRTAWLLAGSAALALLGGALWWFLHAGQDRHVSARLKTVEQPDGPPADFSPQDWDALKEVMSKTRDPEAELKRMVAYLRFQKALEQWQYLQRSQDKVPRQALAARLIQQIPERLNQGEVTMGEAWLLASALWADIEPDEGRRNVRLAEFQAVLTNTIRQTEMLHQTQEDAQRDEYKRREATIVQEYQSRPESLRDQAWLEGQLNSARRAVYGAN
jgi:hypothetical protein